MRGALGTTARRAWRWLAAPEQPAAAIEVRPRSLGLVGASSDTRRGQRLGSAALVELPEGALELSLVEPNVADEEAFSRALTALVERAGLAAGARVALVLPDAAARTVLLELEGAGAGTSLEELVRFRLRKVVPFDVREARVAALRLPAAAAGPAAVLAVAAAGSVIASYEAALERRRLHVGLVELSGLALLRFAAGGDEDRLLVNWDSGYLTLVLTRAGRPLLIRTLVGEAAADVESVGWEVSQTLLYYRDRLGGQGLGAALVRADEERADALRDRLEQPLGFPPTLLTPWTALGAAVPGGAGPRLAGAAACLLAGERAA